MLHFVVFLGKMVVLQLAVIHSASTACCVLQHRSAVILRQSTLGAINTNWNNHACLLKGKAMRSDAHFSESVDMSIEKLTSVLEDWKRNSDPLALHPDRLLRTTEVCLLANLPSAQAVHHAINNLPGFPPGGKMGKIRVWKLSEITDYIARLPKGALK